MLLLEIEKVPIVSKCIIPSSLSFCSFSFDRHLVQKPINFEISEPHFSHFIKRTFFINDVVKNIILYQRIKGKIILQVKIAGKKDVVLKRNSL